LIIGSTMMYNYNIKKGEKEKLNTCPMTNPEPCNES